MEATLEAGGKLSHPHALMLEVRRAEGNQGLWAAAAGQPEHVRAYAARLMASEDLLETLPRAN